MNTSKLLKHFCAVVFCSGTTGAGLILVGRLLGLTPESTGDADYNIGAMTLVGFYLGLFVGVVTALLEPQHKPIDVLLSSAMGLAAVGVFLVLITQPQVNMFSLGGVRLLLLFGSFGALVSGCGFLAGSVCFDWLTDGNE